MDDPIARIRVKLETLAASQEISLRPPLEEEQVSTFESAHNISLPSEFRRFITELGEGGYGPTYGLLPKERWLSSPISEGRRVLERPFLASPESEIFKGSDPQGRRRSFAGTLTLVHRGGSDFTLLVVTGPGRGRLVEINVDGFFFPRYFIDPEFLSWYERWLDFVAIGHHDLTLFADQMGGDEQQLIATMLENSSVARCRAAAYTLITYPNPSPAVLPALLQAFEKEKHPAPREGIVRALAAQGEHGRDLVSIALEDAEPDIRRLAAILMGAPTPHGQQLHKRRK